MLEFKIIFTILCRSIKFTILKNKFKLRLRHVFAQYIYIYNMIGTRLDFLSSRVTYVVLSGSNNSTDI